MKNLITLPGFLIFVYLLAACNPPAPPKQMFSLPQVTFRCAEEKTIFYNDGNDSVEIKVSDNYTCGGSTLKAAVRIYKLPAGVEAEPIKDIKLNSPKDEVTVKVPPGCKVTLLCPGSSETASNCDYVLSVPGTGVTYTDSLFCAWSTQVLKIPPGKDTVSVTLQFSDICGSISIETYTLEPLDTMYVKKNVKNYNHEDMDIGPAPAVNLKIVPDPNNEVYVSVKCGNISRNRKCKIAVVK